MSWTVLLLVIQRPEGSPRKTEDGALEGGGVAEELRVATFRGLAHLFERAVVSRIRPVHGVKRVDGVPDGFAEGAGAVLGVRLGDDPGARRQTDGGLDTDDSIAFCWVNDAAVCFGADGERDHVSCHGNSRPQRSCRQD